MLRNSRCRRRRGTTAVEFAFAFPIVFFLMLATMVGGMGVFRYQQVAAVAREGSRWACVHGGQYEQDTGNPAATPEDIYNKAILPAATTLTPARLWELCDAMFEAHAGVLPASLGGSVEMVLP